MPKEIIPISKIRVLSRYPEPFFCGLYGVRALREHGQISRHVGGQRESYHSRFILDHVLFRAAGSWMDAESRRVYMSERGATAHIVFQRSGDSYNVMYVALPSTVVYTYLRTDCGETPCNHGCIISIGVGQRSMPIPFSG